MTQYRITKYNPKFRDDRGSYINDSEWTAISDIGEPEFNNLSYEDYEKIETAYVKSIISIIDEKNIRSLRINSLDVSNINEYFENVENTWRLNNLNLNIETEIKPLKNGLEIGYDKLDNIIRLILREAIYAILTGKNIEVEFGSDYYMYVKCDKLKSSTIEAIEQMGLFVEQDQGPIQYILYE